MVLCLCLGNVYVTYNIFLFTGQRPRPMPISKEWVGTKQRVILGRSNVLGTEHVIGEKDMARAF